MKLFTRAVLVATLAALALATPAAASHGGGTGSCAGGAPGAIATIPGISTGPGQGPSGPGFVKPIATSGNAGQTIETLHGIYCNQQPPGPPPGPASRP